MKFLVFICVAFFLPACGGSSGKGERTKVENRTGKATIDPDKPLYTAPETSTDTQTSTGTDTTIALTTAKFFLDSDGLPVSVELKRAKVKTTQLAILLHEEESNLHEFDLLSTKLSNDFSIDTLSVDLPNGGRKYEYDNLTVLKAENKTFLDMNTLQKVVKNMLLWGQSRGYTSISLTASAQSCGVAIKESRNNVLVQRLALLSPPTLYAGERLFNYITDVKALMFIAAPAAENSQIDALLGGLPLIQRQSIARFTNDAGTHGTAILLNEKIIQEYIDFIIKP